MKLQYYCISGTSCGIDDILEVGRRPETEDFSAQKGDGNFATEFSLKIDSFH